VRTEELNELAHFLVEAEPEPKPRCFFPRASEVPNLVRLLLIPAGWLSNPTEFKDPGPIGISIEYPSRRPGWRICFSFAGFDPKRPTDEVVTLQFLPAGWHGQGIPALKFASAWPDRTLFNELSKHERPAATA
jgi:hypothetical protein